MRANRFSNVASTYDRHADPQRALADSLSIIMPDCNPNEILEIGSGTGILTQLLINTYPVSKIHGIDLSLSMIKLCKKRFHACNCG